MDPNRLTQAANNAIRDKENKDPNVGKGTQTSNSRQNNNNNNNNNNNRRN